MSAKFNTSQLKPLILLADSQLLFIKEDDKPYLQRLHQMFPGASQLSAAYVGAANGDKIEFYEMFVAAMRSVGIHQTRHIKAPNSPEQMHYLENAQVILLAGGDVYLGWQYVKAISQHLANARRKGAVIMGISAGAVHLGSVGWRDKARLSNTDMFGTLNYIPAIFSAHEEKQKWTMLQQLTTLTSGCLPGLGIPSGAGILVAPNNNLQAIRKPMVHLSIDGNKLQQQSLWQLNLSDNK